MSKAGFKVHRWEKHPSNPVLPPGGGDFDVNCCMNPYAIRRGDEYYLFYAGIGSRFGAYSLCEAVSADGLLWERGTPGENLAMAPSGTGWESKMVEYPNVIEENGMLRLFYCGNGYGTTGIGTALAEPLE